MPLGSFRPRFHFSAPTGFLNDPNGLIHAGGLFHLFYQYHPEARPAREWEKQWGHATSRDLVSWLDHEVALRPEQRPADRHGCWSGCAVDAGDEVRLYYTGLGNEEYLQNLCLARGDVNLRHLVPETNPLAVSGFEPASGRTFRDPFVWRDGESWRALIAGALPDAAMPQGVLELASDDGISWRVLGPRIVVEPGSDLVCECPNRLLIADREIILCSAQPLWAPLYAVGREGQTHRSGNLRLLLSASRFYAPLVFQDANGRLIMMGYCEEARSLDAIADAQWCNVLSLPIELSLEDDQLRCRPVEELSHLRRCALGVCSGRELAPAPRPLDGIAGNQCEIELEIECGGAGRIFFDVLADPGRREYTRVAIDSVSGGVEIHNAHASRDPSTVNQGGIFAKAR